MADLVELAAHERMTVEQCLNHVARKHTEFSDILICGYDAGGDFVTFSSHMSRQEALWLAMLLVDHARGLS